MIAVSPVWRTGLALLGLALAAAACSASATREPGLDELEEDAFFRDGFGETSLDEIYYGSAPSVGWLAGPRGGGEPLGAEEEMLRSERAAAGAGEVVEAELQAERREGGEDLGAEVDGSGTGRPEKPLSQKAQEATLATLSVLVGAGMAALPFLVGGF